MTTLMPLAPETRTPLPHRRSRRAPTATIVRPEHRVRTNRRAATRRTTWPLLLGDAGVALFGALAAGAVVPAYSAAALAAIVVVWVALLALTGSYRVTSHGTWAESARTITFAGLGLAEGIPLLGLAFGTPSQPARVALLAPFVAVASLALHRAALRVAGLLDGRQAGPLRIVVAGHRREVQRILGELASSRHPSYDVVSVCGPGALRDGGAQSVCAEASRFDADAVLVAPCRHVDAAALRRLGWQLETSGTRMLVTTSLLDVAPSRTRLRHAGPLAVVDVRHSAVQGGRRIVKQLAERVAAAVGLVVLAPLFVLLAVLIRLDSEGGALFRQTRIGKDGVPFTMLKFRTMHRDAERRQAEVSTLVSTDSILFKLPDDPRTTRVGKVLRRYSLDELPQLVNVVTGDMSLVGPRPPMPDEVVRYQPDVRRRLAVKPGITGLWQVSGRSDLSWDQSVRLDLRYVDNWSLALDIGILARTIGAVVRHRGAY
jgi:exopolysaccharide biosynthesis polyprenyl glycosylphosphotransferase